MVGVEAYENGCTWRVPTTEQKDIPYIPLLCGSNRNVEVDLMQKFRTIQRVHQAIDDLEMTGRGSGKGLQCPAQPYISVYGMPLLTLNSRKKRLCTTLS